MAVERVGVRRGSRVRQIASGRIDHSAEKAGPSPQLDTRPRAPHSPPLPGEPREEAEIPPVRVRPGAAVTL